MAIYFEKVQPKSHSEIWSGFDNAAFQPLAASTTKLD